LRRPPVAARSGDLSGVLEARIATADLLRMVAVSARPGTATMKPSISVTPLAREF